jgi:tetrahydrodipicolinate N-succinyltransferase
VVVVALVVGVGAVVGAGVVVGTDVEVVGFDALDVEEVLEGPATADVPAVVPPGEFAMGALSPDPSTG